MTSKIPNTKFYGGISDNLSIPYYGHYYPHLVARVRMKTGRVSQYYAHAKTFTTLPLLYYLQFCEEN